MQPENMGITLPHEHLLIDVSCWFVSPKEPSKSYMIHSPVVMEMLGDLRRNSNSCLDNMKLSDVGDARNELLMFKANGGRTLVDLTPESLGRDPLAIREISQSTGVNVVLGTGWYIESARPDYIHTKSAEELATVLIDEFMKGIANTGIKPGVIGEIGFSNRLSEDDKKILAAVSKVQSVTGAAVTIHPATENDEQRKRIRQIADYLDILEEGEADLKKVYMSHTDYFLYDMDHLKRLVDRYDITLSIDQFFASTFYDEMWPGYGPPEDEEKTKAVIDLLSSGYEKRVMISHDICLKHHLVKYGGYGYAHILKTIVPMLKYAGVSDRQIDTILVENPKNLLQLRAKSEGS
jgi:phosphotriesterase-related protein